MQTIQLQGVGQQTAKTAANLQAGDVIVWNYGSTTKVIEVAAGDKTVSVKLAGGYIKRFKADRLVAVQ